MEDKVTTAIFAQDGTAKMNFEGFESFWMSFTAGDSIDYANIDKGYVDINRMEYCGILRLELLRKPHDK